MLSVFRDGSWASSCGPLSDPRLVQALDAASPFEWVPLLEMLDLMAAVSKVVGQPLILSEYEHAVGTITASPVLSPLVEPLFRIFGARTFPMAFPRGWALLTHGVADPKCWIDERASWVRFSGLPPELAQHPLLSPTLVATLRAVVDSIVPGTQVWEDTTADVLTIGVHSAAVRAG